MITGPRVDVYVGTTKKHYCLPKLLLCHYSDFFDCCFNGEFIEGQTQKLNLPEDEVVDFEVLLEYMLYGNMPRPLKMVEKGPAAVKRCMDFLVYADKYNLGVICDGAIYKPLKAALTENYTTPTVNNKIRVKGPPKITAIEIGLTFRIAPAGSSLRKLVAQASLSAIGVHKSCKFAEQEEQIDGFASEFLQQLVSSVERLTWRDPLTDKIRTD